jgi:hypothetical protein
MIHLVKSQLGLLRERMLPVKRRWTGHASPRGKLMIIEMRTHKTKAGMRSRFIETLRTKSIPVHAEIGL